MANQLTTTQIMRIVGGWLLHRKVTMALLFLALIASLFPISLLWKLRTTTMTQIQTAIENQPALREVYPDSTFKDSTWFDNVRQWPEVDYLIPAVLNGMMTVEIENKALDLLPSSHGDPILGETHSLDTKQDQIVLSALAAKKFSASTGTTLNLQIYRDDGNEYLDVPFEVAGILPAQRDELTRAYVSLQFLEQLEAYRSGIEVKAREWPSRPGFGLHIPAIFDGAILATVSPRDLPASLKYRRITRKFAQQLLATRTLPDLVFVQLELSPTVTVTLLNELYSLLNKFKLKTYTALLPYVLISEPRTQAQQTSNGSLPTYQPLSGHYNDFSDVYEASLYIQEKLTDPTYMREPLEMPIGVPYEVNSCSASKLTLHTLQKTIPCTRNNQQQLRYHNQVLALARANGAILEGLLYDSHQGWIDTNRGYAGMRIYANTLADLNPLRERLRAEGIESISNQSFASSFHHLDKSLRKYLLILSVFIIGGAISVISLNFAAIARMQTQTYALLKLFGVSNTSILAIPCIYVLVTILPAWIVAELLSSGLAQIISSIFGQLPGSTQLLHQTPDIWSSLGSSGFIFLPIAIFSVLLVYAGTSRLLRSNTAELFHK